MLILDLYKHLLVYVIVSFFVVCALYSISYLVSPKLGSTQKLSVYECGFEPINFADTKFNLKFYLIIMLFIIFDLEIIFIFPWAINLGNLGLFGFYVMCFFLLMLIIGFIYEYKKGALEW